MTGPNSGTGRCASRTQKGCNVTAACSSYTPDDTIIVVSLVAIHESQKVNTVYTDPPCVAQGRFAEAEPLMRRSLDIHEKVLGLDHPAIATSLNDYALLFRRQVIIPVHVYECVDLSGPQH